MAQYQSQNEKIAQAISHYQILEKLGAGGMGIVYQARDLKLNRLVAIKFLAPELTRDKDAIARFIHEAQTVSALNHPNICTVHEIDEANGAHFMVMEFVDGETLREILAARGALPIPEMLDIVSHVADALKVAHARGIIHRDIKPDNIMISRAGYVKVMDFGLAKLKDVDFLASTDTSAMQAEAPVPNLAPYALSSLYGTDAYMSPEQIDRLALDERTDVFSLGVVLYEMAAGRRPFVGHDDIAVMKAILNTEPQAPLRPEQNANRELNRVILKALANKPENRHASMAEFINDLKKLQTIPTGRERSKRNIFLTAMAAALILIMIGFVILFSQFSTTKKTKYLPPGSLKMSAVGITSEAEDFPSFSPEAKEVVYSARNAGVKSNISYIGIRNLETGAVRKVVSLGNSPHWCPDGFRIAYSRMNGIYLYDLIRHDSLRIVNFGQAPKWSPDGKAIVFSSNLSQATGEDNDLYTFDLEHNTLQKISPALELKFINPSWSPDGRWIICAGGEGSRWNLWLIAVASLKAFPIIPEDGWFKNPVWCPSGKFIYFLSGQNGPNDIWRVPVDLKTGRLLASPVQITTGLDIRCLEIAPTGDKLIFSRDESKDQIWRVSIKDAPKAFDHGQVVMANMKGTENIEISPDGSKLILETTNAGVKCLLLKSLIDNTEMILYQEQYAFAPSWSPDGNWIAFDAGGGNQADIWRIPASGGRAEKIISNPGADWSPTYSPDGRHLCYLSNRSGELNLWIHDFDTGNDLMVTHTSHIKTRGFWSHDARKLAYFEYLASENCSQLSLYDCETRITKVLVQIEKVRINLMDKLVWKKDDSALYYMIGYWPPLMEFSLSKKKAKVAFAFVDERMSPSGNNVFAIHNDFLYYVSANMISDLWIAEGLEN